MNVPLAAATASAMSAAVWLVVTTPQAFPFGDVAVIEMMARASLTTPIMVGPYSQYGWNHPGPLLFYALAPLYAMSGFKSIAIALSASIINLSMLATAWWALTRHLERAEALGVVAALAMFTWRAGDLVVSPWNAHVIVMAIVAIVALAAMASFRDGGALWGAVAIGSFAAQSSVAVVPCVGIIVLMGVCLGALERSSTAAHGVWRRTLAGAIVIVALLWLPPIVEALYGSPGNLTKVVQFFSATASGGVPLRSALPIWAGALTAPFRADFTLAWGDRDADSGTAAVVLAALLLVGGGAAICVKWWCSGRRGLSRLSGFAVLGALTALWSTTRIVGGVGDYQVYWMGGIGALLAGCIMAAGMAPLAGTRLGRQLVPIGLAVFCVVAVTDAAGLALRRSRQYAQDQTRHVVPRRAVALETVAGIKRSGVKRVRFSISPTVWLQAAGVVLHVYREGIDVRLDETWVRIFGERFRSDGREDAAFEISGACASQRPVMAQSDGLCVYAAAPTP